jgi:hypothetical protein
VHSALAIPLSTALKSTYLAIDDSAKIIKNVNNEESLNSFIEQHNKLSKLQSSLGILKNKTSYQDIADLLFIDLLHQNEITEIQISSQRKIDNSYQVQQALSVNIKALENNLYPHKTYYQEKSHHRNTHLN